MTKKKQVQLIDVDEPKHDQPFDGEIDDPLAEQEAAGFDFKLIYHPLSKYSVELKIKAVMAYMMTGDGVKAAKIVNVPHSTLMNWKKHSCWWEDTLHKARVLKQDELDAELTKVIQRGTEELKKRIENGNTVKVGQAKGTDPKTGNEVTQYIFDDVPISAKELATVIGITYDKRALSRGEATSRSEISGGDGLATLGHLINNFQKIGEQARLKRKTESIDADFSIISPEALEKIKEG